MMLSLCCGAGTAGLSLCVTLQRRARRLAKSAILPANLETRNEAEVNF